MPWRSRLGGSLPEPDPADAGTKAVLLDGPGAAAGAAELLPTPPKQRRKLETGPRLDADEDVDEDVAALQVVTPAAGADEDQHDADEDEDDEVPASGAVDAHVDVDVVVEPVAVDVEPAALTPDRHACA